MPKMNGRDQRSGSWQRTVNVKKYPKMKRKKNRGRMGKCKTGGEREWENV